MAVIRKVRTPEGARFYGLPIGSPITADLIAKKDGQGQAKGLTPPKQALTSGAETDDIPSARSAYKIKVTETSLVGPQSISVGSKIYDVPEGSKVIRPNGEVGKSVAYVRTPNGKVHVLNEHGEVQPNSAMKALLKKKFGADFAGDSNYEVEQIGEAKEGSSLTAADAPAGSIAVDSQGEGTFTKQDNGTWTNDALGLVVSDEELDEQVEAGDLILSPPPEGDQPSPEADPTDASQTPAEEPSKAVDLNSPTWTTDAPEGTTVYVKNGKGSFTKDADGWHDTQNPQTEPAVVESVLKINGGSLTTEAPKDGAEKDDKPAGIDLTSDTWTADAPEGSVVYTDDGSGKYTKAKAGWVSESGTVINDSILQDFSATLSTDAPQAVKSTPGTKPFLGMDKPKAVGALNLFSTGEGVYFTSTVDNTDIVFEKVDGKAWKNLSTGVEYSSTGLANLRDYLVVASPEQIADAKKATSEADRPETTNVITDNDGNPRLPETGKPLANLKTEAEVKAALDLYPTGTVLKVEQSGADMTKNDKGQWIGPAGSVLSDSLIFGNKGNLVLDKMGEQDESTKPQKDEPAAGVDLSSGTWSVDAPAGSTVYLKDGSSSYTKQANGTWMSSSTDIEVSPEIIQKYSGDLTTEDPKVSKSQKDEPFFTGTTQAMSLPEGAVKIDKADLESAEAGDKFFIVPHGNPNTSSAMLATKNVDGTWGVDISGDGSPMDFAMENLLGGDDAAYVAKEDAEKWGQSTTKTAPAKKTQAKPKTAAKPQPKAPEQKAAPKVGDKISGDSLETVPTGSTLTWKASSSNADQHYVKSGPQIYVDSNGMVYPAKNLEKFDFVLSTLPAQAKQPGAYKTGDKIEKYGHLREFPTGTQIRISNGVGDSFVVGAKQDDGSWQNIKNPSVNFAPNAIADAIVGKRLTLEKVPADWTPNVDPDAKVTLVPGGPEYTQAQIAEAYNALTAHTGFQIKYGFKSIPDNPLADAAVQKAISAEADKAFPTLKAKPAFVAYLKDKAGISDPEDVTDSPAAKIVTDAPKIKFGPEDPEFKAPQGWNGGEFTAEEVAEAISILEKFDGKLFKAELNKNNNALGTLDPTKLVGTHKDKTVAKQKFIEMLQGGLTDHNKKMLDQEAANAKAIGETLAAGEELPDGVSVPTKKIPATLAESSTPLTVQQLVDAPIGTVVADDVSTFYTKTENESGSGIWVSDGPDPDGMASGFLHNTNGPIYLMEKVTEDHNATLPDYAQQTEAVQAKAADPDGEHTLDGKKISEMEVGDAVTSESGTTWTKAANGQWLNWADGNETSPEFMQGLLNDGYLSGYTPVPKKPKTHLWSMAEDASVGAIVNVVGDDSGGKYYVKQANGFWKQKWSDGADVNYSSYTSDHIDYLMDQKEVEIHKPEASSAPETAPAVPETNPTGLVPGKYVTGPKAKAYMVVHSDGTGTYVNGKGEASKITAAKVKAVHEAGMQTYQGLIPDSEIPAIGEKKAPPAKKVKQGPVEMPEGTFYLGDSTKANATAYVVSGDKVKIYKGGYWEDPSVTEVPLSKIKTAYFQGKIVDKDGNSVVPKNHSGALVMWNRPTTVTGLLDAQKALSEQDFPKNFMSGGVGGGLHRLAKLGVSIDPTALIYRMKQDVPDFSEKVPTAYGYQYDDEHPIHAVARDYVATRIDTLLENADTEVPEYNTSALFDWDTGNSVTMPDDLVGLDLNPGYYSAAPVLTATAKAIAAEFGGGKILIPPTNKHDKNSWITAFGQGNFAGMYMVEVKALHAKGKSHPAGPMHPGHPANTDTHKVTWGSAVPGEIPAGAHIEGNWSDVPVQQWSPAEIDNFMIKAQAQYADYLTLAEKRQWVQAHRKGSPWKSEVDALSIKGKKRKAANEPAQSKPLVWTDDVVPAKAYDFMFDNGPSVDGAAWQEQQTSVAKAWAKDNITDPDFKAALEEQGIGHLTASDIDAMGSYGAAYTVQKAVAAYWDKKHEAYLEELNKPVYQQIKTLGGGSHAVYLLQDQFGRKVTFKPTEKGREFRTEVEAAGNNLSVLMGFDSPNAWIGEFNGKGGLMMNFIEADMDLGGPLDGSGPAVKLETLTPAQVGQIAGHHVADWILDNDDTHRKNIMVGDDGKMWGIDKGRALFTYGSWKGLSQKKTYGSTSEADHNAPLVYTALYDGIRSGKISEEQAHAAYQAARKAARRVEKADPAAVEALVRDGVKHRTNWKKPHYTPDGKYPQNADELVAAVLERKANMTADIEKMWDEIFEASPYTKPEIPPKALGEEHFSGWEEPGFAEAAEATRAAGVSAVHAHAGIQNGTSLLYTTKAKSGKTQHHGELKTGNLTQNKILGFLQSKVGTSGGPADVMRFPNTADWKSVTAKAAKDASKHVSDQAYDTQWWDALDTLETTLDTDLAHWAPDLEEGSDGLMHFPSGKTVAQPGLLQYRLMLEHYKNLAAKSKEAKANGLTTNKDEYQVFAPAKVMSGSRRLTGPEGEIFVEAAGGAWLHYKAGAVHLGDSPTQEMIDGTAPGWESNAPKMNVDPVHYTKVNAYLDKGSLAADGTQTKTGSTFSDGNAGYQYEIVLPTGEKITFRNSTSTSTQRSQRGRINFTLAGDADASLVRVQDQLQKMGLDLTGAEEDDAETVYWRQMFSRVLLSSGGDSKVTAARAALKTKAVEAGKTLGESLGTHDIIEGIGLTMTPEEERTFFHDLAVQTWGADKVSSWISTGNHMVQYQHMNLADPTMATGKGYYKRIDVDVDALKKTGTLVAIGNNGKDVALNNYITTGGMLSTEERMRVMGTFKTGASSTSDQGTGGATGVFTRLAVKGSTSEKSGAIFGDHVAYWSPEMLAHTGTYSFTGDEYGNVDHQEHNNKYDPAKSATQNTSSSNETLVQNTMSIYDYMEIFVFSQASSRNEAIQRMKALGIEQIRGLPIEERFIMRADLAKTLQKVRAQWTK